MSLLGWVFGAREGPRMGSRTVCLICAVLLVLYIMYLTIENFGAPRLEYTQLFGHLNNEKLSMRAAGNRTLGFSSIKFINLPERYDRLDAATIQAYLAGIDFDVYRAVPPTAISDVGMPPTSGKPLTAGEKGCWRAHANVRNRTDQGYGRGHRFIHERICLLTSADLVGDAPEQVTPDPDS
jgi:hypothetical protein